MHNNYKFTSWCLFETPIVGVSGRGPLRVSTINIRPRIASHGISWVPGTHVRFGDLDFIVTVGGELALAHAAIQSLPSIGFNYGRLEHRPGVSPRPQPSREDPRRLTLSLEHSTRSTPTVLSFGLRNTAATVSHLVAQRMIPSPANNEFVGVIEHITKSLHNLLTEGRGRPLALTPAG